MGERPAGVRAAKTDGRRCENGLVEGPQNEISGFPQLTVRECVCLANLWSSELAGGPRATGLECRSVLPPALAGGPQSICWHACASAGTSQLVSDKDEARERQCRRAVPLLTGSCGQPRLPLPLLPCCLVGFSLKSSVCPDLLTFMGHLGAEG